MNNRCLFMIMALSLGPAAWGQKPAERFDASAFPMTTFGHFELGSPPSLSREKNSFHFDSTPEPLAVDVIFSGKVRPLGRSKSEFMRVFCQSMDAGYENVFSLYKNEVQVTEDGLTRWVPVQQGVFKIFTKEVKPGDRFIAFLRHFGQNRGEQIYLMIDYEEQGHSPRRPRPAI